MLSQLTLGLQRRASSLVHMIRLQRRAFSLSRQPVEDIIKYYEDFIGLTAVRKAQDEVLKCENQLNDAQKLRREKQAEIKSLQGRLKDIHTELDRTSRGEDKYLDLLTEEHSTIKKERRLMEEFEMAETAERDAFSALSNRVRYSHEQERQRGERTKYWSISASLLGALFGIIGTTVAAEIRMKRIKEIVPTSAQLTPMLTRVGELVDKQHDQFLQVSSFIKDLRELMHYKESDQLDLKSRVDSASVDRIVNSMSEQHSKLTKEMDDLKRLIALEHNLDADTTNVVYVGNDMEMLLSKTERNLESKMKLQTLALVVVVYTGVVLAIPLFFAFNR